MVTGYHLAHMAFTEFVDEIRSNPLVLAVGGFILIVIIWYFHNKANATTTAVSSDTTGIMSTDSGIPPITQNITYNTYPVTSQPAQSGTPIIKPPVVNPPVVKPPVVNPPVVHKPPVTVPPVKAPPPKPVTKYVTVTKWPSQFGTLSGIAQAEGLTLSKLEALNPSIKNPNLIYPGQQVRVS